MSWLGDIFKGVTNFFSSLFKAPKVTLPTIELPTIELPKPTTPVVQLPLVKSVDKARPKGVPEKPEDISQFSSNLTPSLRAILGLSVPNVAPGLLIPGAKQGV